MAFTPTNARGSASPEGLRSYGRFAQEYIMDRPPVDLFSFMNYLEHDPDNMEGMGAGAPEFGEVSTSEIGAVLVAANDDAYGQLVVLPYWMDPSKQIDFRVLWSNAQAAATGSFTVAIKYTPVDISANLQAVAVGATALDSTIDAQVDRAANLPQWTEYGYISEGKAGVANLTPGDDLLCLTVVGTLTTITSAHILGAQMRPYRKYI